MNAPERGRWWIPALALLVVVLAAPLWLPQFGLALTLSDALQPGDTALVLEGTGKDTLDVVEGWRQQGLIQNVVVVEAPIKTHALVAYWSDFVRWGLAPPPSTPAAYLRVVRAPSTQAEQQAFAALPALDEFHSHTLVVPGGGGIGSRLVARQLAGVLNPRGIGVRMVGYSAAGHDPGRWWQDADDRRAVLDSWLQLLVPFLSGYEPGAGS